MKNRPTPDQMETITKLVRTLCETPHDHASLSSAAEQIANGNGNLVLEALLKARGGSEFDEKSAVIATMPLLETMMDASPGVAGYLMARLYPIAARRKLNHIDDAIGLWMVNSASEELAESLTMLANEGTRPSSLRRIYAAWAENIRRAHGRAR
jgi:hypothetical protein